MYVEIIGINSEFVYSSMTMEVLSATQYPVVSDPTTTIGSLTSKSVYYPTVPSNISVTQSSQSSIKSDLAVKQTSQSFLYLIANNAYSLALDLTCSVAGTSTIAYSTTAYNGVEAPTWVTISSAGVLSATTPSVSNVTEYQFYVSSLPLGSLFQIDKLVTLRVTS